MSPSSRRAWIEIQMTGENCSSSRSVALLAEGVDRNSFCFAVVCYCAGVALLAEGVDRNISVSLCSIHAVRRPPRGGRG